MLNDPFKITEVHLWNQVDEFSFVGFKELANQLRKLLILRKLHKDREYKIIISEV